MPRLPLDSAVLLFLLEKPNNGSQQHDSTYPISWICLGLSLRLVWSPEAIWSDALSGVAKTPAPIFFSSSEMPLDAGGGGDRGGKSTPVEAMVFDNDNGEVVWS